MITPLELGLPWQGVPHTGLGLGRSVQLQSVSPQPVNPSAGMGASHLPMGWDLGQCHSPAGSPHLCLELSWVLLWLLDGVKPQHFCMGLISLPRPGVMLWLMPLSCSGMFTSDKNDPIIVPISESSPSDTPQQSCCFPLPLSAWWGELLNAVLVRKTLLNTIGIH